MKAVKSIMITATVLSLIAGTAHARTENLRCRLMSKAISETSITVPGGQSVLNAARDGGVCLLLMTAAWLIVE